MTQDELREQDEKPYREAGYPAGPVSMGGGRKKDPQFADDGTMISGTGYEGCPGSPDGYHHYTAVSCIQSVEHFVCDHCPDSWWD